MTNIFDSEQLLARPAIQELLVLLVSNFHEPDEIRLLAKNAGMLVDRLYFRRGPGVVWPEVLEAAANQALGDALMAQVKKAGGPAMAKRVDEILSGHGPKPAEAPAASPLPGEWHGGDQNILGTKSTLLDVDFLETGLRVAKAVCKLEMRDPLGRTAHASAFLIGPRLLLSNYHALFCKSDTGMRPVPWVEATFLFERGETPVAVPCDMASIRGAADFDWAVVTLDKAPPEACKPLALGSKVRLFTGDPVFIIQHPAGGPKKIGLYRNEVRYLDDKVVQYLTDTQPGSSGSPVMNDRWEVIGLHHRWIRPTDARPEQRNQGINIQRVIEGLAGIDIPAGAS